MAESDTPGEVLKGGTHQVQEYGTDIMKDILLDLLVTDKEHARNQEIGMEGLNFATVHILCIINFFLIPVYFIWDN